jgi:hypothetical protein
MNTIRFSLVLLIILFAGASCSKKQDDVTADAGVEVAGIYSVTQLRTEDGKTYSIQTGYSKTMEVVRLSENSVDLTLEFNEPGKTPNRVHITDPITLKRSGQNITLHAPSGSQVGEYSAKILQLKFTENGQQGTMIGNKP